MLQKGLDWIGLAPGVGEFFDGANAVVYAAQKDWGNAFISAAAMVPFWGNIGTGARIAKNTGREAKEAGKAVLPQALNGGTANTSVYFGVKDGKNIYVGISNNVSRRETQHGDRFDELREITTSQVTRGEARAIEQALIVENPGFTNKINSISPKHAYYDDAVSWGQAWLQEKRH